MHVISSGVHVLRDSHLLAWEILGSESSSSSGCCCSSWVFSGCCWPDMAQWRKEAPQKTFTTASSQARIPKLTHTYHCSHASCIMHHVHCDCLAPQCWEYYPNSRLHYIGHPVTVVTSRELQNRNQAVSKTETWQPYGALLRLGCLLKCNFLGSLLKPKNSHYDCFLSCLSILTSSQLQIIIFSLLKTTAPMLFVLLI